MTTSFVRALGNEAGVQLNPLVDNSEMPASGNADQSFGIAMRATRGRIDKAFTVTPDNFYARLGRGETLRASALNEAWIHVFEALNNGAYTAVVARLVGEDAKNKWMTVKLDGEKGTTFAVAEGEPADYDIAIKHHECFNDGIKIHLHADEKREGGKNVDNDMVTLAVTDSKDVKLYEFTGSLTAGSRDDYGKSNFLSDVVESLTEHLEVMVKSGVKIKPSSNAYGFNENGELKWTTSKVLNYFDEGVVGNFTTETYVKAREMLQKTQAGYSYIASGGTQAIGLLSQLMTLSFNTNRQFRFDVPGHLTPEQAIAFIESLNPYGSKTAQLIHAYWTPLKTNDPTGVNGKSYIGTSGLNIGLACGRNAAKNQKGFAPKNYPIAGKLFPITRNGIVQTYTPQGPELSQLAAAKINPVVYEAYETGGLYVFLDSLTCAPVTNSLRKLISVAEMSSSVDDAVTGAAKMFLQMPMKTAVNRMKDWMQTYFEDAQTAEWIIPSEDAAMTGGAFKFEVKPNAMSPFDKMDVNYWVHYDGTDRQIFATQTLSK
ncbi:hypothetical protein [Acinetobacter proteolyticus]|uniref:Phage tail protein n=1 Tax=Acinetobacter proteolyticus TaxID=1776741 RepID=A0A2N0WIG0_9GAMM|nr:hypothetical protein [Acinetobacter proteolyticus]PKF35564.1 hypothetical protein CW311_04555 [Acinetobacter proteolyticus]